MKKLILSVIIILTMSFTISSCKTDKKETKQEIKTEAKATTAVYQCPMDCEKGKTYNKPGSCPVCKMDLKPVKEKAKEDHSGHNH